MAKQRGEKSLHPFGEQWMRSIVFIRLAHGHQGRSERTLAALGYDDMVRLRQVGGEPADESELEAA